MSQDTIFDSDSYEDGRTKQAFKDSTDINRLLEKAQKGEAISHLAKHGAVYADYSDIDDLLTAANRLQKGEAIFQELPSELRREFMNSSANFFKFVNDPANVDRLPDLIPGLAKPGNQAPAPIRTAENPGNMPPEPPTPPEPPVDPGPPTE